MDRFKKVARNVVSVNQLSKASGERDEDVERISCMNRMQIYFALMYGKDKKVSSNSTQCQYERPPPMQTNPTHTHVTHHLIDARH